jgi:hypothetical protein
LGLSFEIGAKKISRKSFDNIQQSDKIVQKLNKARTVTAD